jgi:hypothetical protein
MLTEPAIKFLEARSNELHTVSSQERKKEKVDWELHVICRD